MKEKIKELEALQKKWIKHHKMIQVNDYLSHYWEGKMRAIEEIIDLLKNQKQSGV